jgi:hypothetical protein
MKLNDKDTDGVLRDIALLKLQLTELIIKKNRLVKEQLYLDASELRSQEVELTEELRSMRIRFEQEDRNLKLTTANFDRKHDLKMLIHELTFFDNSSFVDEAKIQTKNRIEFLKEKRKEVLNKSGNEETEQSILLELADQRNLLEILNRIIKRSEQKRKGL